MTYTDIKDEEPAVDNVSLSEADDLISGIFNLDDLDKNENEDDNKDEPLTDKDSKKKLDEMLDTSDSAKGEDASALYEKEKKQSEEHKKHARAISRKMNEGIRQVKKMNETGQIDDDMAENIINVLEHGSPDYDYEDLTVFDKVTIAANKEIENIRKYSEDTLIDKKIKYFDRFIMDSTDKEKEYVISRLHNLIDDPIKLTKAMLKIGNDYYEDSGKIIDENGGVKNLVDKYEKKLKELQKEIDKIKSTGVRSDSEDYIKSTGYRLPNGNSRSSKGKSDDVSDDSFISNLGTNPRSFAS